MSTPKSQASRSEDPHRELAGLMDGFRMSQCLHVVAQLAVADAIGPQPKTTDALAAAVGADPDALRRLMRALASHRIFAAGDNDTWQHTPMSRALRCEDPSALAYRAKTLGRLAWASWGALSHSVRTGAPAFDHVHGGPLFAHLREHPDLAEDFGRAMTSFTRDTAMAAVAAHDFSRYEHVVDVGGGHGVMLDVVLQACPNMRATLVDRPEVTELGAPQLRPGTRARCDRLAADFFEDALPAADAYILSWVLHDWGDDDCIRLLRQCARAMGSQSELLIIEMIVPPGDGPSAAKMFDLEMLVQTGGRERSLAEYATLLGAANLGLIRRVDTRGPHSLLVAGGHPRPS